MHTAAALSRTDDAGIAAAEAADTVAASLAAAVSAAPGGPAEAPRCDLVVVAVTPTHADHLEDVAAAVETRLEPGALIGAVAEGVVGPGEEVTDGPAVVVWALAAPGCWVQPFHAWTLRPSSGGVTVAGWPDSEPGDVTVVLADAHSFPAVPLVERLSTRRPGAPVVGGLLTAGTGPTRLLVDGRVHDEGAVGVVLRDVVTSTVVSGACRPIGRPVTVTEVEGDAILALAGQPATDHLDVVLRGLGADDLALLESGGLQLGIVADEVSDRYGAGDFLLRGVLGVTPDRGAITVGDRLRVGSTVQFHLRDPVHAGIDLTARLRRLPASDGALLFTCTGRGVGLFGAPHHDARAVGDHLDVEVAGVVCDGELGPLGDRSVLHGFSATVLAFGEDAGPPAEPGVLADVEAADAPTGETAVPVEAADAPTGPTAAAPADPPAGGSTGRPEGFQEAFGASGTARRSGSGSPPPTA